MTPSFNQLNYIKPFRLPFTTLSFYSPIPTDFEDNLTYEDQLIWIYRKIKEIITNVNGQIEIMNQIIANQNQISEEIQELITAFNREIANLNQGLQKEVNERITAIQNLTVRLNNMFSQVAKNTNNIEEIQKRLAELQEIVKECYNPVWGRKTSIQRAIFDTYNFTRPRSGTADYYDNELHLTAEEYDNKAWTAKEYDQRLRELTNTDPRIKSIGDGLNLTADGVLETNGGGGGGSNITVVQTAGTSETDVMSQKATSLNLVHGYNLIKNPEFDYQVYKLNSETSEYYDTTAVSLTPIVNINGDITDFTELQAINFPYGGIPKLRGLSKFTLPFTNSSIFMLYAYLHGFYNTINNTLSEKPNKFGYRVWLAPNNTTLSENVASGVSFTITTDYPTNPDGNNLTLPITAEPQTEMWQNFTYPNNEFKILFEIGFFGQANSSNNTTVEVKCGFQTINNLALNTTSMLKIV